MKRDASVRTGGGGRKPRRPRPILFATAITAIVLALTADERVFGLVSDGQIITRTAYSMLELGEIGIARGHAVNVERPSGDVVSRYGMGPSLVQLPPMALAGSVERTFGPGASQTLFVGEQLLLVLLAALGAGALAKAWGASPEDAGKAILVVGLSSPLWGYVSSEFSEPLQAAVVAGTFALATLAAGADGRGRRTLLLALGAGACAGFALLAKSVLIVLLPVALFVVAVAGPREGSVRRAAAVAAGWLPFAALWLTFEIVRFGRPFASYQGEHFNHPVLDGLWRVTVGPNKGLFVYFPAALLAIPGAVLLFRSNRRLAAAALGFAAFLVVTTAAWWSWDGTAGWGPRLLIPLVPLLGALAALALRSVPAAVFWILFTLGVGINAIGAFQPDALTTCYFTVLPRRPLTDAEAARYPAFATVKNPATGGSELLPLHDVARHAAFCPIKVAAWLVHTRMVSREPLKALADPPWRTDVPGQEVAIPPEQAIPSSARGFLTAPFRWPHLGMSLTRRRDQRDTALAYVDAVYDQALRAEDMKRPDRALDFGARLYELVPGPQTAVAMVEGYRYAGRREMLQEVLRTLPRAHAATPELGMVLALYQRDLGDETKAKGILDAVLKVDPDPRFQRLAAISPKDWPPTLRDILRTR